MFEYRKINLSEDQYLTVEQIADFIDEFNADPIDKLNKYYFGRNPTIIGRAYPARGDDTPINKIPVSYARKVIRTVTGYMYKPGNITYISDDENYFSALEEIFDENQEPIKSSQLGKQSSIQGVGYELHYLNGLVEPGEKDISKAVIRFSKIPATEMIPVYNYDIEPKLVAAIRFYKVGDILKIACYYRDIVREYKRSENAKTTDMILTDEWQHYYEQVPLVVYLNNEEGQGDFENVTALIDAYDVLASDSMDEFESFRNAYLRIVEMGLEEMYPDEIGGSPFDKEGDKTQSAVSRLKQLRIFEHLQSPDAVTFLTKDIPTAFIEYMTNLLQNEIHKQTHIPDFLDSKTGDITSGVAIDKLLYDFEFIAATKEAYFREGLQKRIELINTMLKKQQKVESDKVNINMERNVPARTMENAEVIMKLAGHVSKETLLEVFAPYVQNVAEELEKLRKEQSFNAYEKVDVEEENIK